MFKKLIISFALILSFYFVGVNYANATDDYYVYEDHVFGNYITGVNGFVDISNRLGRGSGKEYIFFVAGPYDCGSHTAYVYEVTTTCSGNNNQGEPKDVDTHPSNPNNTGSICPRIFTYVSSHPMGAYCSGHDNGFFVNENGIYYGASNNGHYGYPGWASSAGDGSPGKLGCALYHWDFNWNPVGCVINKPGINNLVYCCDGAQTLAYDELNGYWWLGTGTRMMYRWNGAAWEYQFTYPDITYPSPAESHGDGITIVGDSLFVSDMTADNILQYKLNNQGKALDKDGNVISGNVALGKEYNHFIYSNLAPVEIMGYGPSNHIWISGWAYGNIYELGGGRLQQQLTTDAPIFIDVNRNPIEPSPDEDQFLLGSKIFTFSASKEYLNIFWNASYSKAPRQLAVECYLNCDPRTETCGKEGQCLPFPYIQLPGPGSCSIPNPQYKFAEPNVLTCRLYDPKHSSLENWY